MNVVAVTTKLLSAIKSISGQEINAPLPTKASEQIELALSLADILADATLKNSNPAPAPASEPEMSLKQKNFINKMRLKALDLGKDELARKTARTMSQAKSLIGELLAAGCGTR